MYCTRCGVQMEDVARFCSQCGTATPGAASTSSFFGSSSATNTTAYKRLVRLRNDRWIGGVCSGLARYFGLDVVLVRILFIAFAICPVLPAFIPYIVCWIVMPTEPEVQLAGYQSQQQPMGVNR